MLRIFDQGQRLCDGLTRREWMRIGGLGLGGLTLQSLLASQAASATGNTSASFGKAKSVILFGLVGGPPQHETWDPKPDAPQEVRGEFGAIDSKTAGLRVGELMPLTAKLTDKIAVLRAVVTGDNAHSSSGYQMLTGIPHQPLNRESALPKPPNNWPSVGAITRALRDRPGQLPAAVTLPEHIWNDGNIPWPGQDAGFLGHGRDPWLIPCNPHEDTFHVPGLKPSEQLSEVRFNGRRTLLDQMNGALDGLQRSRRVETFDVHARKALDLLGGRDGRTAFDLSAEPDNVKDRYGRGRFAQSILLARRLVEAGVSLVQVNWTRVKGFENQGGWDTHKKHSESLKKMLMPTMDQAYAALLADLDERGLLDETLVVWIGEFGHTPRFNKNAGRDHWGHAFSVALAGGGIRGGVVHGETDQHAAFPLADTVRPKDILATVFHCLGYHPETVIQDPFGRPLPISRGQVIRAIV